MAMPVSFREFTPRNSRDDLLRRLEQAPAEHVEALLAAYDLLERLHETGLLDTANGLLSAGETVVQPRCRRGELKAGRQRPAGGADA